MTQENATKLFKCLSDTSRLRVKEYFILCTGAVDRYYGQ